MKCWRCCKVAEHRRKGGFFFYIFVVMKCGEDFYGEQNSQIDRTYLLKAPLTFPHRLIFELCLYNRLSGLLFHRTSCIIPLVLSYRAPFACTVLCLPACLCVPRLNRTFPGELSSFRGQTVCCPPWCLFGELVLWEQLFREQILINGRTVRFLYLVSHISVKMSKRFLPCFLCLSVSGC